MDLAAVRDLPALAGAFLRLGRGVEGDGNEETVSGPTRNCHRVPASRGYYCRQSTLYKPPLFIIIMRGVTVCACRGVNSCCNEIRMSMQRGFAGVIFAVPAVV